MLQERILAVPYWASSLRPATLTDGLTIPFTAPELVELRFKVRLTSASSHRLLKPDLWEARHCTVVRMWSTAMMPHLRHQHAQLNMRACSKQDQTSSS